MFRNLTFFRFPKNLGGTAPAEFARFWDADEGEPSLIERSLRDTPLKPVGPMDLSSSGFVSPYGGDNEAMVQRVGAAALVTVGRQDKLLPAAVINDELEKRLKKIRETGGLEGGGSRRQVRDDVVMELLPRAFVQPSRLSAYFDLQRGFIAVDTSSRKAAENVVSEIRHAIGSFPAVPLHSEVSPRAVLTRWLSGGKIPNMLDLGDECELHEAGDKGAVMKFQRSDLGEHELQQHLHIGMQCTRLSLTFGNYVSFVIGEDLVVRKLKLLDGAGQADVDRKDLDGLHAELDARLALVDGVVGRLFDTLSQAFKLTEPEVLEKVAAEAKPKRGRKKVPDGIDQVTITVAGRAPVTMSGEQFAGACDAGLDPLLGQAIAIVRETGKASISGVQRRLKIGYNRAARLVEAMELAGVVTPPNAAGDRQVNPKEPHQ